MVTITLTDDDALALAKVVTALSPAEAGQALRNDHELANFLQARQQLTKAAEDVIYRERVTRRG